MIPQLLGIGASLLLPMIMKKVGAKMVTRAVVPVGMALVRRGARGVPRLVNASAIPRGYTRIAGEGASLARYAPNLLGTGIAPTQTKLGKGMENVGGFLGGTIPWLASAAGRGTQAAATGAGALLNAAGSLPLALDTTSPQQYDRWGGTGTRTLGQITSGLGNAAGIGASALGNAAGSVLEDWSQSQRLADLRDQLSARALEDIQRVQSVNADPSTRNLVQQMLRTGRM